MRSAWRLVIGYIRHRPLSAALAIGLVALGTGLLSLLLLLDRQLTAQFDRNLAGVDLVIGAKGSPLQLVTSTLYHADAPTGNVPVAAVAAFARPEHPLIGEAVPLGLGDSYRGRRIVGTTAEFYAWYGATVAEGVLAKADFEVTLGHRAAEATGLKLGDTFQSVHGLDDNPDLAHADVPGFRVSGILKPTGLVIDELIVTPLATIWKVHGSHDDEAEHEDETASAKTPDEEAAHEHEDETASAKTLDEGAAHETAVAKTLENEAANSVEVAAESGDGQPWYQHKEQSITALLAKFSARNTATLNFARNLNENTDLMAASPPVVMAQFSEQVAGAEAVVRALGQVILFASTLSLLVILLNALRERMGDLSLLRSLGATPRFVFGLVLLEGLALAALGALLGLALGRLLFFRLNWRLSERYPVGTGDYSLHASEPYLLGLTLVAALVAALYPAWRAYRVDPGVVEG